MRAGPRVLHLAVEYNDPTRPRTTTAVEWFVEALAERGARNTVVSMVRTPDPRAEALRDLGPVGPARVFAMRYLGLPLGIGLDRAMARAAERIARAVEGADRVPDAVHSHKLTFEGLAGDRLARRWGVPHLVSLRAEVETKVFRRKPLLRPRLRRIAGDAARVFHVSPWFRDEFHAHVPSLPTERPLPNIVRNVAPAIAPRAPGERFVTILNLDLARKKGLPTLLDGLARASRRRPHLGLDVIGGGTDASAASARALAERLGVAERTRFLGSLPNAEVLAYLPEARALLLPSLNETFGMVYVEALFAGVPVLHTQGTGIDGWLDGLDVSIAVPPRDAEAVARAIETFDREAEAYRDRVAAAGPELFHRFDPERHADAYIADLAALLAPTSRAT